MLPRKREKKSLHVALDIGRIGNCLGGMVIVYGGLGYIPRFGFTLSVIGKDEDAFGRTDDPEKLPKGQAEGFKEKLSMEQGQKG